MYYVTVYIYTCKGACSSTGWVCPFILHKNGGMIMSNGLIAVIIVSIVIIGAIATRRCTEFLFLGSILGAIVLFGLDAPMEYVGILQEVVGDPDNVWLWLVCGLFGSLIFLLQAAKSTLGFQRILEKICTNERRTMLAL